MIGIWLQVRNFPDRDAWMTGDSHVQIPNELHPAPIAAMTSNNSLVKL